MYHKLYYYNIHIILDMNWDGCHKLYLFKSNRVQDINKLLIDHRIIQIQLILVKLQKYRAYIWFQPRIVKNIGIDRGNFFIIGNHRTLATLIMYLWSTSNLHMWGHWALRNMPSLICWSRKISNSSWTWWAAYTASRAQWTRTPPQQTIAVWSVKKKNIK